MCKKTNASLSHRKWGSCRVKKIKRTTFVTPVYTKDHIRELSAKKIQFQSFMYQENKEVSEHLPFLCYLIAIYFCTNRYPHSTIDIQKRNIDMQIFWLIHSILYTYIIYVDHIIFWNCNVYAEHIDKLVILFYNSSLIA